jgi:hypothetical protein
MPVSVRSSQRRRGRAVVVFVTAAIVLAISGVVWYVVVDTQPVPRAAPAVTDDGPTFAQAYVAVNESVGAIPSGPWTLSQAFGIASPLPSSPSSWGWPGTYPQTMTACGEAFNGITIWNGTLPLFTGTYNSGTAPFWQLVFFSNQSEQLLVATVLQDRVTVFPAIGLTSPCATYSRLGYQPWNGAKQISEGDFPPDTPAIASSAWNTVAQGWVQNQTIEPTEMYQFGDLPFGSGGVPSTQLQFFACGTLGGVGATPGLSVFTSPNDPSSVSSWSNYTLGCTPTADNWTAVPVHAQFNNSSQVFDGGASYYVQEEALLTGDNSSDLTDQTLGITTWMMNLTLTNSTGGMLGPGSNECSNWTRQYSDCRPDVSGWYAVLLSAGGQWLDSYGLGAHESSWALPVVPIVSGQYLVLVVPDTWSLTNATLAVSSTTSGLPLSGSYVIP